MYRFWESIFKPILSFVKPKVIVQIGAANGELTTLLAEQLPNKSSVVHVVDLLLPDESSEETDQRIKLHRSLSLNVLGKLKGSVVFRDGDPNWYTTFNELRLIEKRCRKQKEDFPLVFLHNTGWPYARRDRYNDPDVIPEAYRKSYRVGGIDFDSAEPVVGRGVDPQAAHAICENDLQNGVLTAVEDFIEQSKLSLNFVTLDAFCGLGILVPEELLKKNEKLKEFLASNATSSAEISALVRDLERERAEVTVRYANLALSSEATAEQQRAAQQELAEALDSARKEAAEQKANLSSELAAVHAVVATLEGQRDARVERITAQEQAIKTRDQQIETLTQQLADRDKSIAEYETQLADRDLQLDTLRNEMQSQLTRRDESIESERQAHQKHVLGLERRCTELIDESKALHDQLASAQVNIESARQLHSELRRKVTNNETRASEIRAGNSRAHADLTRLRAQRAELQQKCKRLSAANESLERWLDQLEVVVNELFASKRWKMGNTLGDLSQRLLMKGSVPMPADHLTGILTHYRDWKQRNASA